VSELPLQKDDQDLWEKAILKFGTSITLNLKLCVALGLRVVEFWSENCIPCKQLTRVLSQISAEIPRSVRIGTVEVNDNVELATRFGIQATPTLLFFKDGALADRRSGVDRRLVLKKIVETHA
jgi:thioredoxin 1